MDMKLSPNYKKVASVHIYIDLYPVKLKKQNKTKTSPGSVIKAVVQL